MHRRAWPFIDIYILNYNARDDIRIILQKLKHIDYPRFKYWITVVDNNSVDGSKKMLVSQFPYVRVISLKKNHGMSALNFGFKKRTGEFCFVLDDDSYFERTAIKKAIEEFSKHPLLGVLACNTLSPNRVTEFKYLPQHGDAIDWCDFIGGGSVIRSSVFRKVGYFSPDIFMYGHETHFSLRVLHAGYAIKFAPSVHVYRTDIPSRMNAFRMRLGPRNFIGIYWTFLSVPRAFTSSVVMLMEYFLLAVRYTLYIPFFQGLWQLFTDAPNTWKHRTPVAKPMETYWAKNYPFTFENTIRRLFGINRIQ